MRKFKYLAVIFLFYAELFSNELTLATGLSIPPYVIKETHSGIELDIVKEVLKLRGYNIDTILYVTNKRIHKLLLEKSIDFALNVPPNIKNIYYSNVIIEFKNVAIALNKNHFKINTLNDLVGKRVIAFQNANKFLGKEFHYFSLENKNYNELINQVAQVEHLYKSRADVVISDKYIFLYYKNKNIKRYDKTLKLDFFDILPSSPRRAVFLSEEIRNEFNKGLVELKKNGGYLQLMQKYNFKDE